MASQGGPAMWLIFTIQQSGVAKLKNQMALGHSPVGMRDAWLWTSYFLSLSLNPFISKMEIQQ